jgi:hypothetical protein
MHLVEGHVQLVSIYTFVMEESQITQPVFVMKPRVNVKLLIFCFKQLFIYNSSFFFL